MRTRSGSVTEGFECDRRDGGKVRNMEGSAGLSGTTSARQLVASWQGNLEGGEPSDVTGQGLDQCLSEKYNAGRELIRWSRLKVIQPFRWQESPRRMYDLFQLRSSCTRLIRMRLLISVLMTFSRSCCNCMIFVGPSVTFGHKMRCAKPTFGMTRNGLSCVSKPVETDMRQHRYGWEREHSTVGGWLGKFLRRATPHGPCYFCNMHRPWRVSYPRFHRTERRTVDG